MIQSRQRATIVTHLADSPLTLLPVTCLSNMQRPSSVDARNMAFRTMYSYQIPQKPIDGV